MKSASMYKDKNSILKRILLGGAILFLLGCGEKQYSRTIKTGGHLDHTSKWYYVGPPVEYDAFRTIKLKYVNEEYCTVKINEGDEIRIKEKKSAINTLLEIRVDEIDFEKQRCYLNIAEKF